MWRCLALLICPIFCFQCAPDIPEEVSEAYATLPRDIVFNQHVRQLLSDRCFSCHGPDEAARKANLRLDLENYAKGPIPESNGRAIVPGKLTRSKLAERILSTDPEFMMPPPESNLSLSAKDKAVFIKWIEQGAEYQKHWAFLPPQPFQLPPTGDSSWVRNEIDQFVLARLEQEGLRPMPPADKERLLRRVSFDLRGLPPTLPEIDSFLLDDSPDAYEKAVDKMLVSTDYAERMTLEWLDVARYADSHGLHADGWRNAWPWRDWVIQAFRQNMPYDEFIIQQIAGDLLPNATQEQILATAFNRNHPMTAEGGAIDEEFRVEYVSDRTNTTATAFLGLTMMCARCHDHKFDPISQKEYYQMTAFYNNVKELGMTGDDGNYGPILLLTDEETERKIDALEDQIKAKASELEQTEAEVRDMVSFIKSVPPATARSRIAHYPLDEIRTGINKDKEKFQFADRNEKAILRGEVRLIEGKKNQALVFDNEYDGLYLSDVGLFEMNEAFSVGLWVRTTKRHPKKTQTLLGNTGEKNSFWRGWEFFLDQQNRPAVRLIHNLPGNYLHAVATDSVRLHEWTHLAFSYDGTGKAKGVQLFINGSKVATNIPFDRLYKSILPVNGGAHTPAERALRVGRSNRAFTGEYGIFEGAIDDIQLFDHPLTPLETGILAGLYEEKLLYQKETPVSSAEKKLLTEHRFRTQHPQYLQLQSQIRDLVGRKLAVIEPVEEVMVMEEMPVPRKSFLLDRGMYDAPGEEVMPGTPQQVLPFSADLEENRLGLARWLTHPDNPLTARVTVNRYWQMLFGRGIVSTPQDFGSQGSLPSHPQLLDWLALRFIASGWDVRELLKLIVTSATYRQSSAASPELVQKDPYNILLARGPKYRLQAELIRDNALHASGLLVRKVGGESVRPYQPEGLWIDKGTFSFKLLKYIPTLGDSLYRKSMYTFVKRTSPHPAMVAFDATSREVCTVQRENTNTPLQALVLFNDPQFVECARVLAQRMQQEAGTSLDQQLTLAFRWLTGRYPKAEELEIVNKMYEEQHAEFLKHPKKAKELLSVGEYPLDRRLNKARTAALTLVASTIMNMDEFYMKR